MPIIGLIDGIERFVILSVSPFFLIVQLTVIVPVVSITLTKTSIMSEKSLHLLIDNHVSCDRMEMVADIQVERRVRIETDHTKMQGFVECTNLGEVPANS